MRGPPPLFALASRPHASRVPIVGLHRMAATPLTAVLSTPLAPEVLAAQTALRSTMPIIAVIAMCLLAMIPTGVQSFLLTATSDDARKRRKLRRRVFTSVTLGIVVSLWIFSGTFGFLAVFAAMAVVAQNEYFTMARQNGCYQTWKLGLVGSVGMCMLYRPWLPACTRV